MSVSTKKSVACRLFSLSPNKKYRVIDPSLGFYPFLGTVANSGVFSFFFFQTARKLANTAAQRQAAAFPPWPINRYIQGKVAFAACARQSAPGGFKRRSNPTIGRGEIEYLHLLIGQGVLVFVPFASLLAV
jgi:hypothetical protein